MTQPGPDRSFVACRASARYSHSTRRLSQQLSRQLVLALYLIHIQARFALASQALMSLLWRQRHGSRVKGPAGSRQRVLYAPQLSRCINPPKRQFKLFSLRVGRLRRPRRLHVCRRVRAAAFAPFPPFLICPDLDSHFTSKRRLPPPKAGLTHFDPGDQ
ncbi:hypothetical protein GGI35DRAFT_258594 [Trichoderma velutinum]